MKRRMSVMLAAVMFCSMVQPAVWVQAEETAAGETASARYIVKYVQRPEDESEWQETVSEAYQTVSQEIEPIVQMDSVSQEGNALAEKTEPEREIERITQRAVRKRIQETEPVQLEQAVAATVLESADETQAYGVVQLEKAVPAEAFMEALEQQADGIVEYIQPDYEMELSSFSAALPSLTLEELPGATELAQPEETAIPTVEDPAETEVPEEPTVPTEETSTTNGQTIVALLDTGVDTNHPDLAGHVIEGYDFYHNTGEIAIQEDSLADVHGTHLAGVIAGSAPEAKIMPLKVFDNGTAYTSDIIRAITYAQEQGAAIVNCSWGSTDNNPALREAMEESPMLFVCAAGNNRANMETAPVYPAAFELPNTISVASQNQDLGMSYYSNYGASVDIAAVGREVTSTYPGGEYGEMNGTSVSAAVVTGAAAAYAGQNGTENLKEKLKTSADKLSCLSNKVQDGNSLNKENLLAGEAGQVVTVYPADDFDVLGYERTPAENWELFSQQDNIQVEAISDRSYFLKSNGSVWICGNNDPTPKQVAGLTNIVDISVSDLGTLFLSSDGQVYTGVSPDSVPTIKYGLSNVTMVEMGDGGQFLVAKNDGTIWGWGENYCGEAGNSETIVNDGIFEGYVSSNIPSQVTGEVSHPKRLVGGNGVSLAIDQNNNLWQWGNIGRHFNDLSSMSVFRMEQVRDIAVPSNTLCFGVKTDGTAFYNVSNSGLTTLETDEFSSAVYLDHNTMVKTDGSVWTWDNNYTLSQVNGINNVKLVSQAPKDGDGPIHTLALKQDGSVWGWGNNSEGQLGEEASSTVSTPIQIGIPVLETPGTVLVDEQYNTVGNAAYRLNQQCLQELGWSEYENPSPSGADWQSAAYGEFSAETGRLVMKKTSGTTQPAEAGTTALVYSMDKTFTQQEDNWQGDSRVTRRKENFKGKYSIEWTGEIAQENSVVYVDMLGRSANGTESLVGRYRVDWTPNHQFSVYNNQLNGGGVTTYPLFQNADQTNTVKTTFDSFSSTFQTFLNGSAVPCSTSIENAYPKDTFSMTGWNTTQPGAYLTKIRFSAQKAAEQNETIATLDSVKLIEYQAARDVTDNAAEDLTMSYLTNTPANVQGDLNTLPTSLDGANITWTSNNPTVMSNDGILLQGVPRPTDVVMTAKITNPADGFIQYLDFRLTVTAIGGKTLVEERYGDQNNSAYHLDQNGLEQLGWSECSEPVMLTGEAYNAELGEFSAANGVLTMQKTGNIEEPTEAGNSDLVYGIQKTFTYRQDNWNNDPRMSVWTQHFKGDYIVEIDGSFHQTDSQVYYDMIGRSANGADTIVGRYRVDPGTSANFSVYNNKLNGGNVTSYPLFTNPTQRRVIATQLSSEDSTFQTFVDNATTPSQTTVSGANPKDTFSMTGWNEAQPGAYLTGIRISAQKQAPAGDISAKLYSVKLIELAAQRDIVDDAIDELFMDMLTDTPEAVTGNLKQLPETLEGAEITWSSSRPDLIDNEGNFIGEPPFDTDVVMTAKVTNPADGFTKYVDFRLSLQPQSGFQESYTGSVTGTPSSAGSEGTKTFHELPMWEFSYPGISNGTNGEVHAGQILMKDDYLIFKKISDRQTDSYGECVVGIRSLSNTVMTPSLPSVNIAFTAKVEGTGTMRFAPLTTAGKAACTVVLDASTGAVNVLYGEVINSVVTQTEQRLTNIDPRNEHLYELQLNSDGTFVLKIDGNTITTAATEQTRLYLPGITENSTFSQLKVWITNITYQNTEIGKLKNLSITYAQEPGGFRKAVTQGDILQLVVSGQNIQNIASKTFALSYDADDLELLDAYAPTELADTGIGLVPGSNMTVTEIVPGSLKFTLSPDMGTYTYWSGVATVVKFRAKRSITTTITLG